ncbi:type IV pilus biogenesis protein PilM [uncultured Pigmentiphaga sp.]|uniref:type IV pilus biogenesis protein PilM n=1 Tax=uncultured Pigmentiphaga sp. TaxID=340361 RepID=UPI0026315A6B|nr:type IV pilus biogenesis protein PilM [uncultured Pigmentiphaga sp.]
MVFLAILAIPVALALTMQQTTLSRDEAQVEYGASRSIYASLAIYRNAVAAYKATHPSATGVVPDSALGLPAWYAKHGRFGHVLTASGGWVYYMPPEGAVPSLRAMAGNAAPATFGLAVSGIMRTLGSPTTIALPAGIPDGSVVLMV